MRACVDLVRVSSACLYTNRMSSIHLVKESVAYAIRLISIEDLSHSVISEIIVRMTNILLKWYPVLIRCRLVIHLDGATCLVHKGN